MIIEFVFCENILNIAAPTFNLLTEKYWSGIIKTHLEKQDGKPSPFACLSPDDSLKLLRCGDVHPNPGPPKVSHHFFVGLEVRKKVSKFLNRIMGKKWAQN